jgi:hypothetical protein
MTRTTKTPAQKTPAIGDLQRTPETTRIESPVITQKESPEPENLEVQSQTEEPIAPAEAAAPEKIQTDVREKLGRRTDDENVFVPSNPVALEKAAEQVAKENGFELNRGTSIGARLLARAQKRV